MSSRNSFDFHEKYLPLIDVKDHINEIHKQNAPKLRTSSQDITVEIEINDEFKTETEKNKIQDEKLKDPLKIEDYFYEKYCCKCKFCENYFPNARSLNEHIKFSHYSVIDKWIKSKQIFKCNFCAKKFAEVKSLNEHINNLHHTI